MGPNDFSDRHVHNNYNHQRVVNDIEAIYLFLKKRIIINKTRFAMDNEKSEALIK